MRDGAEGFLVDLAADPACARLAERTNQLLTDLPLRRRCVEAGRSTAARFDWPVVTARVLALYDQLRAGPSDALAPARRSALGA
jgi:glycosyltransferase involved in cell wall biosynthesis